MQQNCAELMIITAIKLVMKKNIDFQYPDNVSDAQVDISPAFISSPDNEKQMWYSGKNSEDFQSDLRKLDRRKVYFMRTGTNNGAGHWQTFYYDFVKDGWVSFSSKSNNCQITEGDVVTQEADERMLVPHGSWGSNAGQYCFYLVEASNANLIKAANFLYDFRVNGEDLAIEYTCHNQTTFYDQLLISNIEIEQNFGTTVEQINSTLEAFRLKIPDQDCPARDLLGKLYTARNNYQQAMRNGDDENHSRQEFLTACEQAIEQARPTLEKELRWDDVLVNLMKELANAVISVVSLRAVNSFFTKTKSASIMAVEKLEFEHIIFNK